MFKDSQQSNSLLKIKKNPADYNGGRTAKDIINFGMDEAKKLALGRIGEKPSASSSGSGSGSGE